MTTTVEPVPFSDLLQHAGWARRLARQLVREEQADDLFQDAWVATSQRPVPVGAASRRWLAAVMRNLARFGTRTAARRQQRERELGAEIHGQRGISRPDEIAERIEAQHLLASLVLALPAIYRDVVLLRFYDDLPPRQIAARLGVPPGTARSRLWLALRRLREQLEAGGGEAPGNRRRSLAVLAAGGGGGWLPWSLPGTVALAAAAAAMAAAVAVAVAVLPGPVGPGAARSALPAAVAVAGMLDPHRPGGGPGRRSPRHPPLLSLAVGDPAALADEKARQAARAEMAERYQVPLGAGPLLGPPEARVTILEFVDYQCPFTARAQTELARVLSRYREEVRFQVIHRPLPFHPQAGLLARAALAAAEQGRFWQLHAGLMASGVLERWTSQRLEREARQAGLDVDRFRGDLDSPAVRARAEIDEATASSVKVEGTPIFFVNGRFLGGADAPRLMPAVIDEELARAEHLLARGAHEGPALYNAAIAGGKDVLMQPPPVPAAAPGEQRPPPDFERIFREGAGCGPLLEAPVGLELAGFELAGRRSPEERPEASRSRRVWPWSLMVANGERYRRVAGGKDGAASLSSTIAGPHDFVAQHQMVVADPYHGKRLRFRAEVKGQAVDRWAGIWIRALGADGRVLVSARTPIASAGAPDWHPASAELTLPREAKALSFGLLLAGRGSASMRQLALEVVGADPAR